VHNLGSTHFCLCHIQVESGFNLDYIIYTVHLKGVNLYLLLHELLHRLTTLKLLHVTFVVLFENHAENEDFLRMTTSTV